MELRSVIISFNEDRSDDFGRGKAGELRTEGYADDKGNFIDG